MWMLRCGCSKLGGILGYNRAYMLKTLKNNKKMSQNTQKNQKIIPSFISGGTRYSSSTSTWQQFLLPRTPQSEKFLWLEPQNYTCHKHSIYSLTKSQQNPTKAALISYNVVAHQLKQWKTTAQEGTQPLYRDYYGITDFDGRVCVFGGQDAKDGGYFSDVLSYCGYSDMWVAVVKPTTKVIPMPRLPFVFVGLDDDLLFVFGGKNDKGILRDAFVLENFVWRELTIANLQNLQKNLGNVNQIIKSEGIRYAPSKRSVFFFGGIQGTNIVNDFYQLTLENYEVTINKITQDTGPRPCPRAFHSMQKLGVNCIAVYGGVDRNQTDLRDLSIYDTIHRQWTQIYPLNGPLPLLTQPKLMSQGPQLHILGILSQYSKQQKQLVSITFQQFEIIRTQICTNCVKRLESKQRDQISAPKKPFVSNGLIHNMAMQLAFPFQAFSLLVDCAQILEATSLAIRNQELKDKLSYLDIRFNGKPLTRRQYYSLISHSYEDDKLVKQIVDKLKLGALRLGKTLVYISVCDGFRRVFLFSADSLIISHYHEIYAYLAYEERIIDEWVSTIESVNHKKFILNLLQAYFKNPKQMINEITHHCFLIFESNVLMTTEKIYYGQLISNTIDITLCKSNKKVQFLDSIGFRLSQDPQVSLSKYLSYLYKSPTIQTIKIQQLLVTLPQNRYLQQLQKLEQSHILRPLIKQKVEAYGIQAQCYLYEVYDSAKYVKDLRGIFLYYKGRLINRLDVAFGELFWKKFFKSKYKRAYGIWEVVGLVDFLGGVEVKMLGNQFKNNGRYNAFIRNLKKDIIAKQQAQKQIITIDVEEEPKCKPNKRQKQPK